MASSSVIKQVVIVLIIAADYSHCFPAFFNSSIYMRISDSTDVKFGSGLQPEYLPIIECVSTYDPFAVFKCAVYTRERGKCNVTLYVEEGTRVAEIKSVNQLSADQLAIVWAEMRNLTVELEDFLKITTVDMKTCKSANILQYHGEAEAMFYEDGFELLPNLNTDSANRSRASYDMNGMMKGKSEPFTLNAEYFQFFPVSTKSSSKGLFAYTFIDNVNKLSLIEANGKEIKHLIDIGGGGVQTVIASDIEQSLRSLCWSGYETPIIKCAQFDELANLKWSGQLDNPSRNRPFYVHNLKDGGVLLLTFNWSGNTLSVNEMRPNQKPVESTYPLHWSFDNAKALNFNEAHRSFTIVWKGEYSGRDVLMRRYSF